MRDMDIRQVLHTRFRELHGGEADTIIVDELGVCEGRVRIDIAVINGQLNGYEIKSERDTLARLGQQADAYSRVFDTVTLITCSSHLDHATELVPEWWGLSLAVEDPIGTIRVEEIRAPRDNPSRDPFAVAQLLWRDEALSALAARGLDRGFKTKPRIALWERLAASLNVPELLELVRETIKTRRDWRAGL